MEGSRQRERKAKGDHTSHQTTQVGDGARLGTGHCHELRIQTRSMHADHAAKVTRPPRSCICDGAACSHSHITLLGHNLPAATSHKILGRPPPGYVWILQRSAHSTLQEVCGVVVVLKRATSNSPGLHGQYISRLLPCFGKSFNETASVLMEQLYRESRRPALKTNTRSLF